MKNFKKQELENLAKNFNEKELKKQLKSLTEMLTSLTSLDLSENTEIFNKRTELLKDRAKKIEKDIKDKYTDFLPEEDLDSKK